MHFNLSLRRTSVLCPWGVILLLGMGLIGLSGCDGGGNGMEGEEGEPPTVVEGIDNQRLNPDGEVVEFDLESVFSAPEESEVTFSASSSDPSVAESSVQEATLTVTSADAGGETTVTVTAENDAGTAEDAFDVEVFADPPGRP